MRRIIQKLVSNPVVRTAVLSAVTDIVSLYGKAIINVIKKKLEDTSNGKDDGRI